MNRFLIAIAALALASGWPSSLMAQPAEPRDAPNVGQDKVDYCIYADKVYSLGSAMCVGKTGYACVPAETRTNGLGKNRPFWITPDRSAQGYVTPNCT